ncbi:hypothetical protein L1887_36716 [Cichorium endivia]|nr:hypothetical protein L1887_36716 [Cichorium endivia]
MLEFANCQLPPPPLFVLLKDNFSYYLCFFILVFMVQILCMFVALCTVFLLSNLCQNQLWILKPCFFFPSCCLDK